MPYQIRCDGYILDDHRDEALTVSNPVVNLEVNTVGSCTFTIHKNHPYYGKLNKLKSVFEVSDDIGVIFRGRMTEDSADFHNSKAVDLEGAMAYFNDSTVRPFSFPEDFATDAEYISVSKSGNVVEYFLKWLIDRHNEQVQDFQRFKLGNVTVSDPNNYITRSSTEYANTWETLKSKLFDSSLGGYLCIRYESDGNYIDYLSDFELLNTQEIVFGENLLDITSKVSASTTYSAIVPLGANIEKSSGTDGDSEAKKSRLTIESIPDGAISEDLVKTGDVIYSKSAVEAFGWICAPVSETTWDDVTVVQNLLNKGVATLSNDLSLFENTIEVAALDLHFTNEQVQSFRIYRKVNVRSAPHDHIGTYHLPKLSLHLHNPGNTRITVGSTGRSMIDINSARESEAIRRVEIVEKDIAANRTDISYVKDQTIIQATQLVNDCEKIIMSALESYVESSNFDEFKELLKAEFEVWATGITGRVTATEENIANVDGDLQMKFNTITKYFTFDINGLTIGQIDNPNRIVIDNDDITIYASGVRVQEFKADGTSLIPILKVTNVLNAVGLQISDKGTHINCDFVGVD